MSPKDLCTIDFLDRILSAGVRVLKLEGRGRSPEYVSTVTQVYKEASIAFGSGFYTEEKIRIWKKRLEEVYNRGFWDGYYLGQKLGEWSNRHGSAATKQKTFIGKVSPLLPRAGCGASANQNRGASAARSYIDHWRHDRSCEVGSRNTLGR
jgi:U32 family peptidase